MLLARVREIKPWYPEAADELFVNAPAKETPVPFKVRASLAVTINPFRSSVAPLATIVPDPVDPSGEYVASPDAPSFKIPAFIDVKPL